MSGESPSETTPLLRENATIEDGPSPAAAGDTADPGVILADEPALKELLIIQGSIWMGVFFAALDATVVATISAPISSSFNSLSLLSWLASAYLISNAACQPLSGKLTDIFSRRTGLVVSNILFGLGNLICGLAKDEWVMILGRVVAGMGGGGLTAIATFVTSDLVPLRRRGLWQGIGNVCYGAGGGIGGIFGGWINDTWGWRWAFLAQIPFIVVSTVLVWSRVKIPVKETDVSRWKRIDFLGAGTLVLTLVLFLYGINTGGNQLPWTHPLVLVSLALSGVLLVVFIYIEEKVASEPVIPVRLLMDRTVLSACLTNWFCTMSVFAMLLYVPLYIQIQGYSTTQAGARLIAQAVGTSVGSLGLGFLMRSTGRYLFLSYASVASLVVGFALFTTFTLHTPAWPPFLYLFIVGIGYGGVLTASLVALISAVAHVHQAVVTSASYAFRSTGSSIGITVASSVFQNILKAELWSRFGDWDDAHRLIPKIRDSLDEIHHLPKGWLPGVLDAYMKALNGVFVTILALALPGAIVSLGIREHKLHANLARNPGNESSFGGENPSIFQGSSAVNSGQMSILNSPNRHQHRVLLSTSTPFSDTILRSLLRDPDVELRLIADKEVNSSNGTLSNLTCYPDIPSVGANGSTRDWMNITAASLADWADVFIVAPIEPGTLGAMVSGLTTTLTLTILRGWDISKTILVVPKMMILEWKSPLTARQLKSIGTLWPWVKILPPVLSKFDPPNFLVELPWEGREMFYEEIRKGLGWPFDVNGGGNHRAIVADVSNNPQICDIEMNSTDSSATLSRASTPRRNSNYPALPPELLSMIFEALDDWETSVAVGVYTRIPMPEHWKPFTPKTEASLNSFSLEYSVLRRPLHEITHLLSCTPLRKPVSNLTAHLILKFSRTDILDFICKSRADLFWSTPQLSSLPLRASAIYGNIALLEWWKNCPELPTNDDLPDAVDGASRAGFVHVLEWWHKSGLSFRYSERSLESASAEGQIAVLDWWKRVSESWKDYDTLPLKIGKSVLLAAQSGKTASLAWWDRSGIPYTHGESVARIASTHGHVPVLELWYSLKGSKIIFDNQVLVGATKNGHVDVLEWWRRSGLRVEFKTCDIEEALEDAVSGAEERVRSWWQRNGLNLGVGPSEWMKVKVL
ncbi:hypothetical protein LOZ61_005608 [Ophidiomyces ophidiicola]|nr:hypothetical protein LOZ61_005608 [Ophidiomyces ophidiicola]KAI1931047.1 hypothetical protein LOZ60_000481 [Ophidiomyces ophidiicola]KAI1968291.1 hypothetical protein LOZ56_005107 [Ophidiomyces ophidiicola]KAI2148901.1 hypothetical protein LOZ27_001428 [Ophidiomyces ophidiicola]KAI2240110.1 hypothetical protein LOZ13_003168 [Ophidiomyces ophidiicola]